MSMARIHQIRRRKIKRGRNKEISCLMAKKKKRKESLSCLAEIIIFFVSVKLSVRYGWHRLMLLRRGWQKQLVDA